MLDPGLLAAVICRLEATIHQRETELDQRGPGRPCETFEGEGMFCGGCGWARVMHG